MEKYYLKTSKLLAVAVYNEGKMIIQKGSLACKELNSSFPSAMVEIRNDLIEKGILKNERGVLIFNDDFICTSPSQASTLINGSSSNGLLAWKDNSGRTLKSKLRELE